LITTIRHRLTSDGVWRTNLPWKPVLDSLRRFLITLSFIPFEAVLIVESVVLTFYRLFVTIRRLLEWQTAAQARLTVGKATLAGTIGRMATGAAVTTVALLLVATTRPDALPVASPV